ncbi:hypothetical protein ACFXO2_16150 [Streptomyces sp. NPDC059152]|uniref:hypothetical protein n=1 Tax=Streptomyces sp. NPDC059152 TaxID=3346742 RepID=UPI0036BC0E60
MARTRPSRRGEGRSRSGELGEYQFFQRASIADALVAVAVAVAVAIAIAGPDDDGFDATARALAPAQTTGGAEDA